jgi:transcriptional regulator with XRE-family HTH domain
LLDFGYQVGVPGRIAAAAIVAATWRVKGRTMTESSRTPFQQWLQDQLDQRDWSHAKLGRELDLFKGTIGRWLMPEGSPMYRTPSFESCRRLAEMFGVDIVFVLEMVGMEGIDPPGNLTQLQRDAISLIPMIPDDILAIVYEQLRPLIYTGMQESIRKRVPGNQQSG